MESPRESSKVIFIFRLTLINVKVLFHSLSHDLFGTNVHHHRLKWEFQERRKQIYILPPFLIFLKAMKLSHLNLNPRHSRLCSPLRNFPSPLKTFFLLFAHLTINNAFERFSCLIIELNILSRKSWSLYHQSKSIKIQDYSRKKFPQKNESGKAQKHNKKCFI